MPSGKDPATRLRASVAEQDLATVGDRGDPRRPVDGVADDVGAGRSMSPVWSPIRTRPRRPPARARRRARAARRRPPRPHRSRRGRSRRRSRPRCPARTRHAPSKAARRSSRWRSRMSRYGPVPSSSSRRVEPSMSVNRQVTRRRRRPGIGRATACRSWWRLAVRSVPAGFGERPKTTGQATQQRERDRRLLVDDRLEVPGGEREAGGLALGQRPGRSAADRRAPTAPRRSRPDRASRRSRRRGRPGRRRVAIMKNPVPTSPWRAMTWPSVKTTSTVRARSARARPRRRRPAGARRPAARSCGRASVSSDPPASAFVAWARALRPVVMLRRPTGSVKVAHVVLMTKAASRDDARVAPCEIDGSPGRTHRRDRRLRPVRRPVVATTRRGRPHVRGGGLRGGPEDPPPGPERVGLPRHPRRRGRGGRRRRGAGASRAAASSSARSRSSSARPRSPTSSRPDRLRCLVLAGPRVEPFLVAHPRVMYRMLQAQARRLRAANRWRS